MSALLAAARARMVAQQLAARGIVDPRVLEAMGRVPRERFVLPEWAERAYDDQPLPIGEGQTISQPYTVARIAESLDLRGTERVLDVGSGSGYQAAVLARLARRVVAVERLPALARRSQRVIEDLKVPNVVVFCGDGTLGRADLGPYDAIACAAAGPDVPEPLLAQLADGGRLVTPITGGGGEQTLVRVTRTGDRFALEELEPCRFVPLMGRHGFGNGAG